MRNELERTARDLEREWDDAREAASAGRDAYEELEEAFRKERPMHGRTGRVAFRLGPASVALFVLLVVSLLVMWRLFQ